jgi:branched-subunit amino acid ABC-type transport system permease component
MRFIAVAADVAMGVFVGIFLYAVLTRFWPSTANPFVAALVVLAAILIVLFRKPHGALAPRQDRS